METTTSFHPGQTVQWGQANNLTTGTIMTVSLDRKTAFIFLGRSSLDGKPRYITVSTQKLQAVSDDKQRSTL